MIPIGLDLGHISVEKSTTEQISINGANDDKSLVDRKLAIWYFYETTNREVEQI